MVASSNSFSEETSSTDKERIAVLESKVGRNEKDIDSIREYLQEQSERDEERSKAMITKLTSIETTMVKHKSFIGGVAAAISVVWTVALASAVYLLR